MCTRRSTSFIARVTLICVALAALSMVAAGPVSAQQDARLQELRTQEARILAERAWWQALLDDPERLLMPRFDQPPFSDDDEATMPIIIRRADAAEFATHYMIMLAVMRHQPFRESSRFVLELGNLSRHLKEGYRATLMPQFEQDLQYVRQEMQRLTGVPPQPQPVVPPPVGPAGRAWYFRRAIIQPTTEPTLAGFEILDSDASPTGGHIQVKYTVSRGCDETYDMTWTFGGDVSRLRAETRIPVTLTVNLSGRSCNSGLGSSLAVTSPTVENFLIRQAPSDQPEWGAFSSTDIRAAAQGNGVHSSTVTTTIMVNHDPRISNGWAMFRLYAYVPGQFVTIAYLYMAGGS
jgi:hypothetical protein